MPSTQTAAPPARNRPLVVSFRNESGAFDLPSILVGVVVVGILTAGVLAAIFGVIPFAQDKAAQQDLDATRTAEGVAKAQDGKHLPSDGLRTASLLNGPESSVADTDASGSCYVGIARSGSGNLYYSSSAAPSTQELTSATNTGCISANQRDAMITAVGGTPAPPAAPTSVTFTPFPEQPAVSSFVVGYANQEILSWYASPLMLAYNEAIKAGGDGAAEWAAWEESPEVVEYYAQSDAITSEQVAEYNVIYRSPELAALITAARAAENEFVANPSIATQQAAVDGQVALYTAGFALVAP